MNNLVIKDSGHELLEVKSPLLMKYIINYFFRVISAHASQQFLSAG